MEDAIKEMKRAIRNYILETNYDEMDEDARIEKFWQDLGNKFFSDEAIEDDAYKRTSQKIEFKTMRETVIFDLLKLKRDILRQERIELGEESFIKKYPPLTLEEKIKKMREIVISKRSRRKSS